MIHMIDDKDYEMKLRISLKENQSYLLPVVKAHSKKDDDFHYNIERGIKNKFAFLFFLLFH